MSDVDIIYGKFQEFLRPYLEEKKYFVLSGTVVHATYGPLTIMQNIPYMNEIWKKTNYKTILENEVTKISVAIFSCY